MHVRPRILCVSTKGCAKCTRTAFANVSQTALANIVQGLFGEEGDFKDVKIAGRSNYSFCRAAPGKKELFDASEQFSRILAGGFPFI